jgi:translocation and assembly module TamB
VKYLRASIPYVAFAGLFLILGFINSYHLPRFEDWIKVQIEKESREKLSVGILSDSLELSLWPVGVKLNGLKVMPMGDSAQSLSKITATDLTLGVSLLSAVQGQLKLSEVRLSSPRFTFIHRAPLKHVPLKEGIEKEIFAMIERLPISHLEVNDLNAMIKIEEIKTLVRLKHLDLSIDKLRDRLQLAVKSPSISIKNQADLSRLDFGLETELAISEEKLEVTELRIERGHSFVIANGFIEDTWWELPIRSAHIKLRTQMDFPELGRWMKSTFPWISLPDLDGTGAVDLVFAQRPNKEPNVDFTVTSKGLRIEQFEVGDIALQGMRENQFIQIKKGTIKNSAGEVNLSQTRFSVLPEKSSFKSSVSGTVELRKLLLSLGVGDTPLNLSIKTDLICEGSIHPKLEIQCGGSAEGSDLLVHNGNPVPSTIIAIHKFTTQGSVSITKESVSYDTRIRMNSYEGHSKGRIGFEDGFDIAYQTNQVGFDAIENLANLKIGGVVAIEGNTKGNSQHATIDMKIDGTRMELEDFFLGDIVSKLSYRDGVLSFRDLIGNVRNSRYSGLLSINLLKQRLFLAAKIPYFDAGDLGQILSRRIQLPFETTGSGAANIKLWGPLKLNALSFDFNSTLFRGSLAGESYDQIDLIFRGRDGRVTAERAELIKNRARATLSGEILPTGAINAAIQGRYFRLEDSTLLTKLGLNMTGQLDFLTSFKGPILHPAIETTGTLTQMTVGSSAVDDSKFRLAFEQDRMEGQGNFLGKTLHTSFVIPYDPQGPFSLKIKAEKWNFAPLFMVLSDREREHDYKTNITADVDLYSENGGLWGVSGRARLKEILIRRGSLEMSNPKEAIIDFKQGAMTTHNFLLTGPNTFFRIQAEDSKYRDLNVTVNGKLNLGLMALFTPFLDDLRGNLSTSFRIKGPMDDFQLIGTTFIDGGYIRIKGFPHAFENLKADVLFSQSKLLINTLDSELGGGKFQASGRMDIKGFNNIPTQIEGRLANVSLNVPEGVKITGSGPVLISGNWFPFLISGTFNVASGLVDKEFSENDFSNPENRYTNFLPDFLLRETFEPIQLDLQVNGDNPIKVKNSLIDILLTGHLRVKGTPTRPSILGQLTSSRDGKLFFNDTEFEVRATDLKFNGEKDIDPTIYLEAITRVQEYDIQLLAQGRSSRPKIELSSTPPLPERDIISLLALGIRTTDIEQNLDLRDQTGQGAYQIGSAILSKTNLKDLTGRLGIDFQVSSGFNASDNIAENRFTLSKQVNRKLGISFSRTIGGDLVKEEYELKYRLSNDLSVIGSLKQRRDEAETTDRLKTDSELGTVGLDLEYKIEFK